MLYKNKHIIYKLIVGFVDDTYWDEGSRYTRRIITFQDLDSLKKAVRDLKKFPYKEFESGVTGEVKNFYISWYQAEITKTITSTTRTIHLD